MDPLIDKAFSQGGLAIAFVMLLWAFRDLYQRYHDEEKKRGADDADELQQKLADREADRKLLVDVVVQATSALNAVNEFLRRQK